MAMAVTPTHPRTRRFTADEVWEMWRIGLLDEDEPYELLDGELIYVCRPGPEHCVVVDRLNMIFAGLYGPRECRVRVQNPVVGYVDSIPEPDLAIVTVSVGERPRHPEAGETLLLVEVSHSSMPRDRRKGELYATAGAPVYWIIDVLRSVVIEHTGPTPDGTWTSIREIGEGESIAIPGTDTEVDASTFLGPPKGSPADQPAG